MGVRTFFALLVLVLGGLFAWLNWPEVTRTAPSPWGSPGWRPPGPGPPRGLRGGNPPLPPLHPRPETAALLEVRRYARELLHYKKLAEDAEQSRFTELRRYLEGEFQALREAEREELRALKEEVAETLEKHGNTLAAYIGEPEDQILRLLGERKQDPGG